MTIQSKISARAKRGHIPAGFEQRFAHHPSRDLILLLGDEDAQTRTAAAALLGQQKCINAIPYLCKQFAKETALYARLAQSEALAHIGLSALPHLIDLIGKIGDNRHNALPENLFKKWNYPLPRDLAVRTIIKMGAKALPELLKTLEETAEPVISSEGIDAVGWISFYSGDQQAQKTLNALYAQFANHPVVQWKLIRAYQAFPHQNTVELLHNVLRTNPIPQHRWEAARSLGQIGTPRAQQVLLSIRDEQNPIVKKMIQLSLIHIHQNETFSISSSSKTNLPLPVLQSQQMSKEEK